MPYQFSFMTRLLFGLSILLISAPSAWAHWCSNIWVGPARLVVKPEKTTVNVPSSASAKLKVYFQNNFPYTLFGVEMRGNTPLYEITVDPEKQDVHPGQNVLFAFTIKSISTNGAVAVSDLDLQVKFRYNGAAGEGFRDSSDILVEQDPSQQLLIDNRNYLAVNGDPQTGQQSPSLSMATLVDKFPSATLPAASPFFGRTGAQQLIHFFGYRFCYDIEGGWRCGSENCPSPCAEGSAWTTHKEFAHNNMRAGIELAIRKSKLGSELDPARNAAVNAMKGGSEEYKCLSAVVGGMLWEGASDTSPYETALGKVSAPCKAAGLRIIGKGSQGDCATAGTYYEQATCAGAEGLQGNEDPVKTILVPNSGDGKNTQDIGEPWQKSHYYAYMLFLVTYNNYNQGKHPGYYPNVGGLVFPDGGQTTKKDTGGTATDGQIPAGDGVVQPQKDSGKTSNNDTGDDDGGCSCSVTSSSAPWPLLLLGIAMALLRRRRH